MPWGIEDVDKHKKGLTDKQKQVWVEVANRALATCEKKGQGDCEARAIKQADAVAGNIGEAAFEQWYDELRLSEPRGEGMGAGGDRQGDGGADVCVCPECGATAAHEKGKPCAKMECPKCGAAMAGKTEESFDAWYDGLDEKTQALIENHIHGLKSALDKERKGRKEAERSIREREQAEKTEILGDVIPLKERAVADDSTIPIKIIQPGWGTSGYYGPEILERDGPKVFKAGTQMFWDHPTLTEETERPERSLRDLSGELVEDAHWDPQGYDGPGLYSRGKVFDPFKDSVDQLASHIGLSMNGWGRAEEGEAEGKKGPIIKEIGGARSVDFVTVPGAGGQILELFEAARGQQPRKRESEGDDMANEQELKEAQDALAKEKEAREELETETARLREVVLLGKAKDFVGEKLAEQDIPEMTKERLIESLSKNPPVKEGKLDEDKLIEVIDKGVKDEMAYLAGLSESGQVRGLGESGSPEGDEADQKKLVESFKERYLGQGYAPETAERMAEISVRGR